MKKFKSVYELITELKPSDPVYCIRKRSIKKASKYFIKNFPGKILYAVKTNPNKEVVKTLIESGIKNFDVASIKEIQDIKEIDKIWCIDINRNTNDKKLKNASSEKVIPIHPKLIELGFLNFY